LINGDSCSVLRGEVTEVLLTGGGDRSLGDIGQRGVSLSSDVTDSFCGTGALITGSDVVGCSLGVVAADRALCCAAADGGLVLLAEREGLTSLRLFFLDLPGPDERVAEADALTSGRTGDPSREGIGEFAAEAERFVGWSLFVVGIEDDLDVVDVGWSLGTVAVVSEGSEVCAEPVIEVKGLSSIVLAVFFND
jgi:hypothetical protein